MDKKTDKQEAKKAAKKTSKKTCKKTSKKTSKKAAKTADEAVGKDRTGTLAFALAVLAAWTIAVPYVGREIGFEVAVDPVVEVVDHVVPGVIVAAIGFGAVLVGSLRFEVALLAVLGGLWESGTHAPLVMDAARGRVDWGTALWHSLPGFALFVFAVFLAVRAWRAET